MKTYSLLLFVVSLIMTSYTKILAQEELQESIAVKSKSDGKTIQLRWGPTTPDLWWLCNKYGYQLERVTLYRNGKAIQPQTKILADTLKPMPVERWAEVIHDSNLIGVAAQAIHGEDISMNNSLSDVDMVTIINTVKEREMRFSFALSAADQSIAVAEYSGLYYEDTMVKKGETYLYRITANIPSHIAVATPATIVTGLAEITELPLVQEVQASHRNGMVEISWNQELAVFSYMGFWVERSADKGKTFEKIHENPIVNTFDQAQINTRYLAKMDSVPLTSQIYQYRVRGVDAFGEIGPDSKIVEIKANPSLTAIPEIKQVVNEQNKQIRITWDLPEEQAHLIHHQEVYRAKSAEDPYVVIAKNLSNTARYYVDIAPLQSNYYKLAFVDSANQISYSVPTLMTMVDSFPPEIPTNFRGKVDTEGKVSLEWTPSPEDDVAGYNIYRANKKQGEFILRNGKVCTTPFFTDSVSMKILNSTIFYQIAAVDKVGNTSAKSDILRLEKPDLIPPAPTTFKSVKSHTDGVHLSWHRSSSKDVAVYALYRKKPQSEENWNLIGIRPISDSLSWQDQSMTDYKEYYYTLVVVDRAKNESTPTKPVKGKRIDTKIRPAITQFDGKFDLMQKQVRLWWNYDRNDIVRFQLYRQEEGEPLRLYKEFDPLTNEFVDTAISVDKKYSYHIKAVMLDGAQSEFSQIVSF